MVYEVNYDKLKIKANQYACGYGDTISASEIPDIIARLTKDYGDRFVNDPEFYGFEIEDDYYSESRWIAFYFHFYETDQQQAYRIKQEEKSHKRWLDSEAKRKAKEAEKAAEKKIKDAENELKLYEKLKKKYG